MNQFKVSVLVNQFTTLIQWLVCAITIVQLSLFLGGKKQISQTLSFLDPRKLE